MRELVGHAIGKPVDGQEPAQRRCRTVAVQRVGGRRHVRRNHQPDPHRALERLWLDVAPSPVPGSTGSQLNAVHAVSALNILAAGAYNDGTQLLGLIMAWNGS